MGCQTRERRARARAEQQLDLFVGDPRVSMVGVPAWMNLPEQTRSELTTLMAQLMLQHVAKSQADPAKEVCDEP